MKRTLKYVMTAIVMFTIIMISTAISVRTYGYVTWNGSWLLAITVAGLMNLDELIPAVKKFMEDEEG